jgi:hypothetical protein
VSQRGVLGLGQVPIVFAPLVGFLMGVVLAWASRDELTRHEGPLLLSRPVVVAAAFGFFVFAPIVGYFAAFHGDWSYLYLYPHSRIPSAVDLALVLLSGATVALGTGIATPAARSKKLGVVAWLGAVPATTAVGLFAWGARRLAVSATYAEFQGSFGTTPIGASTLGRGVLFMTIAGTLGIAWTFRSLARRRSPKDAKAPREEWQ